jgi:hypothetical protein
MKTLAFFISALVGTAGALGQAPAEGVRYLAQMTFQVSDDFGRPVPNAEIAMSTFYQWERGEGFGRDISRIFTGITNAEGLVTIQCESLRGDFSYGPGSKAGYYAGGDGKHRFTKVKDGRWEPWNPTAKILMKPVVNPIPMYARKIGFGLPIEIPALNKPAGFDLMVGDWVAPHGKGKSSDLVFTLNELVPFTKSNKPFDYVLAVIFTNEGDGIQSVFSEKSALRTPRHAPEGGYAPKLEKQMAIFAEGKPMKYETREDQNYFFRVRTVLDEQGRVKSALYGKIAGDIKFGVNRVLVFNYYLNPTSLDRNMEFDPAHNLFPRLRSLEEVKEP